MTLRRSPIEQQDRWILPVGGEPLSRCMVDAAVHLQFLEIEDAATISVEGPFSLTELGADHSLSPSEPITRGPYSHCSSVP